MQLRCHWTHQRDGHPDNKAVLDVDVDLPTWPAHCPCPQCKLARSLAELAKSVIVTYSEEHVDEAPQLASEQQELIDALLGIRGIVEMATCGHQVFVERGLAFPWSEIKPRVESVIADWAGMEPPPVRRSLLSRLLRRFLK